MSDEELDREWKPNGRPQSTMARSFSLALNDLFKIDNSVADLDAAVSEKKKAVSSQASELEALEARLRATEERLRARLAASSQAGGSTSGRSSPRQRAPLGNTFTYGASLPTRPLGTELGSEAASQTTTRRHLASGNAADTRSDAPPRPVLALKHEPRSPNRAPPVPGALPPTPGASEGEYELVERAGVSADYVIVDEDGDMPFQPNDTTDEYEE